MRFFSSDHVPNNDCFRMDYHHHLIVFICSLVCKSECVSLLFFLTAHLICMHEARQNFQWKHPIDEHVLFYESFYSHFCVLRYQFVFDTFKHKYRKNSTTALERTYEQNKFHALFIHIKAKQDGYTVAPI